MTLVPHRCGKSPAGSAGLAGTEILGLLQNTANHIENLRMESNLFSRITYFGLILRYGRPGVYERGANIICLHDGFYPCVKDGCVRFVLVFTTMINCVSIQ